MATTASSFTDRPYSFRTGKASSAVSSTDGILPAAKYVPATMPLTLVCPRPDSERGAGSRYSWAHSAFAYNVVACVQGGAPPFRFTLLEGPSGATLTNEAPSWNPNLILWARINWPSPTGTGTFKVRVRDQDGATRYIQWTAVTNNTKFRFLDASAGSDSNNGILVADGGTGPWQTLAAWCGSSTADTTYQDLICVYRTGTYGTSTVYGGSTYAAAPADVNTGTDTITVSFGRTDWVTADTISVVNSGGGLPGGLAAYTTYHIIKTDATHIKLATTAANANAGTAIDITSQGTGTHTFTLDGAVVLNSNKPRAHIRRPGETATWDLSTLNIGSGTGETADIYLAIGTANCPTTKNPRLMSFGGPADRVVIDRPTFSGISENNITVGDDNNSCIEFAATDSDHEYVAVVDPTWTNLPGTIKSGGTNSNGFSCFDWYTVLKGVVVGGTGRGIESRFACWFKGANDLVSGWGIDLWDESGTLTRNKFHLQMGANNARTSGPCRAEFGYCRAWQAEGTLNQERTQLYGDSNQVFGPHAVYRMTLAGRVGKDGVVGSTCTVDAATEVNTSTDVLTHSARTLITGQPVVLTTTGTLPGGLALATRYFVIVLTATTVRLATSYANAQTGTYIDITSTGSGTHTITSYTGYVTLTKNLVYSSAAFGTNSIIDTEDGNVLNARADIATDLGTYGYTSTYTVGGAAAPLPAFDWDFKAYDSANKLWTSAATVTVSSSDDSSSRLRPSIMHRRRRH